MSERVRLLLVEDAPSDAELIVRELKRAGMLLDSRRVDTAQQLEEAIREFQPQVILSDFSMPHFDGMEALALVQKLCPDVPFLFVSGTLGEEYAVRALKNGAIDYVLKTNLVRLPAAVERALEQAKAREARQALQRELKDSEYRLDLALEASELAVWEWNLATQEVHFRRHWWPILGYEPGEIPLRIDAWENVTQPEDLFQLRSMLAELLKGANSILDVEYRMRAKNGEWRWIRSVGRVVERDDAGRAVRLTGTHGDVTQRKAAEQKIARLSRIQAVVSGINSAIVRIRDRQHFYAQACQIIVERGGFVIGWIARLDEAQMLVPVAQAGLPMNLVGSDGAEAFTPVGLAAVVLKQKSRAFDNQLIESTKRLIEHKDRGTLRIRFEAVRLGAQSVIVLPLFVDDQIFGVVTLYAREPDFFDEEEVQLLQDLANDISFALSYIDKEERVQYLAYYDALTALPNRSLLLDRLGQQMRIAQRQGQVTVIILADLERFHVVNDTLGRPAGDSLLKEAGRRLKASARAEDTVARVGADQFAISLTNPGDAAEVVQLVQERVSTFLRQPPFLIDGQEFRLTARFGTAVYPADGNNAETLYANAEAALKQAKKSGERVLFYAPVMTARISEALTLENKLRSALEKNQFVLHYQPKVLVTDRKIAGLEALIRWNDPETGLVPPAKFIPLLEETGLILDVGKWALSQVARDCATWKATGVRPPLVAVNVSPIQLRQKDFVQTVMDAFEKTEEAGGALGLEITESVIMQNLDETIDKLSAIRNLGVGISVDDFGTGYSSLAYIARLPIHELKVDRSFIIGITESEESLAIVTSIISLAHSLKLQVVAEGVETETQAAVLDRLGCDQLQGYLFSKPLPAAAVPNLISTR